MSCPVEQYSARGRHVYLRVVIDAQDDLNPGSVETRICDVVSDTWAPEAIAQQIASALNTQTALYAQIERLQS